MLPSLHFAIVIKLLIDLAKLILQATQTRLEAWVMQYKTNLNTQQCSAQKVMIMNTNWSKPSLNTIQGVTGYFFTLGVTDLFFLPGVSPITIFFTEGVTSYYSVTCGVTDYYFFNWGVTDFFTCGVTDYYFLPVVSPIIIFYLRYKIPQDFKNQGIPFYGIAVL